MFEALFEEPDGFRPPTPQGSTHCVRREEHQVLNGTPKLFNINLIGNHSLWAHCLWNAGRFFAQYLDENKDLCTNKRVLELGAGGALPSLVAACNYAEKVLITDYPEQSIIEMIQENVHSNLPEHIRENRVYVKGYLWGTNVKTLISCLEDNNEVGNSDANIQEDQKMDMIILSDLICNHREHDNLLKTASDLLKKDGSIFVIYSSHRPWLAEKDLNFFKLAQQASYNFKLELVKSVKMEPMFENDPGDLTVRSTVDCYRLFFS